jgi:drug/metabolite transporter (DMT)-like permease
VSGRRAAGGGTLRATLFVALSACSFGSIAPLTVIATRGGAALPAVQGWRYLTSAIALSLVAALWRRREAGTLARRATGGGGGDAAPPRGVGHPTPVPAPAPVPPWWHPRILLVAGGGQALVATLALSAVRFIPAATAGFLFYTYPAWVALLAAVRGDERLDRRRVAALVLALGGVAAMVGAPAAGAIHPAGAALALGAAVWYALYIPILGRLQHARAPLDVAQAIAWGGALCFVGLAAARGALLTHVDRTVVGASMLQGLLSTVAFLGFLAGLRTLGAVRSAITSTVEPFWTTLLGVLVLGQSAGPGLLAGGAGIVAGVVLLQWGGESPARAGAHPRAPDGPARVDGADGADGADDGR